MKKSNYVLIERTGSGPMIEDGYDFFLAHWGQNHWKDILANILDEIEPGQPFDVRLTILEMTQTEYEAYLVEHEIDVD